MSSHRPRAVDHGRRLADRGACVPWEALAAIERAQDEAAARRMLRGAATGTVGKAISVVRRLQRRIRHASEDLA